MFKYLFEAHFKDGTRIQQTQEDLSATEPSKSAFYDVAQRMDEVEIFGLFSDETNDICVVDLRDGHFEVNGVPFHVGTTEFLPDTKFRLIYFRKVKRHFHVGSMEQVGHEITFNIGWQTTVDGKNFQETIEVK